MKQLFFLSIISIALCLQIEVNGNANKVELNYNRDESHAVMNLKLRSVVELQLVSFQTILTNSWEENSALADRYSLLDRRKNT